MNLNFSLIRLFVFLCALLFGFSSMAETVIKHKPVKRANSGERIPIAAQITDVSEPAKSIRLVRVYFSADSGEIKHFVPLNEEEKGNQFSGLLPATDVHTESVTYQILVVNDADEIQKSEELTIDIEADEEAAARLISKDPTDIHVDVSLLEVFSEYAPGIDQAQISGFQNYTVNYVSPGQAYGVTGQVVEPGSSVSSSSTGTGASSPGTYSGQVATTGAAAGVSVGALALAGAAVAVGSGGSDGAPTPTPAPMCPAGQVGTPPDCMEPPTPMCPPGQIGTPPDCMEPRPLPRLVQTDLHEESDGNFYFNATVTLLLTDTAPNTRFSAIGLFDRQGETSTSGTTDSSGNAEFTIDVPDHEGSIFGEITVYQNDVVVASVSGVF